jgi:hypothetical protein
MENYLLMATAPVAAILVYFDLKKFLRLWDLIEDEIQPYVWYELENFPVQTKDQRTVCRILLGYYRRYELEVRLPDGTVVWMYPRGTFKTLSSPQRQQHLEALHCLRTLRGQVRMIETSSGFSPDISPRDTNWAPSEAIA